MIKPSFSVCRLFLQATHGVGFAYVSDENLEILWYLHIGLKLVLIILDVFVPQE